MEEREYGLELERRVRIRRKEGKKVCIGRKGQLVREPNVGIKYQHRTKCGEP
jgi:hypothetical protein